MKQIIVYLILIFSVQGFIQNNDKKNPFKHVILLGMENHSFDNMLGYMPSPIGTLNEETYCNSYKFKKYCTEKGADYSCDPDPAHSFTAMNKAIFGTEDFPAGNDMEQKMSWYAHNQGEQGGDPQGVMSCFTPEQVPIISKLASEFKVYTRWFHPIPAATDPNKYFYAAASSKGNTSNCEDWYCFGYPMTATTIFDNLQKDGYDWKIHWQDWNELMAVQPMNRQFSKFIYDQDFTEFYKSLEQGTLSDYTYLIPRIYWDDIPEGQTREQNIQKAPNTQHPSEDVRSGEMLIKKVYETLRNSEYWEDTLLIISYDESGGFHDHIPPPKTAVNPSPESYTGPEDFEWKRYGIRVPGIAISPWLSHSVDDTVRDHSTIPKTIKEIFNLKSDYLSERDKIMDPLFKNEEILSSPRQDCPMTLPEVPSFEEKPLQYVVNDDDHFQGTIKNQVYLLGSMMMKQGQLSENRYLDILSIIDTQKEAKDFLKEAQELLGYIPKTNKKFKYLSRNEQQNLS